MADVHTADPATLNEPMRKRTGAHVDAAGVWTNFPHRFSVRPERVVVPDSREALARVLREAKGAGSRVRVVGAGHSYSDVAIAPETQVHLSHLNRVLDVDLERRRLTVEGGITLREMRAEMKRHGLAFENMGDTDFQTIAGALSTGTHGTGLGRPAFASQVTAIELMLADGSTVWYTADDGDPFDAARVSLGALGIIVAVTVQAVPEYTLSRVDTVISRDEAYALLADPPAEVDHVGVYFMPYIDEVLMWSAHRVPQRPAPRSKSHEWIRDIVKTNRGLELMGTLAHRFPRAVPQLNRAFAKGIKTTGYIDTYDKTFLRPLFVRHDAWEFAVPTADGPATVAAMMTAIESRHLPYAFPCETRIAGPETAWLHPCYGRQSTWVGAAIQSPGFDVDDAWQEAQDFAVARGGRSHWGKWNTHDAAQLAGLYPRWDDFLALRATHDPDGLFGSPAIDRLLGRSSGARADA